MLFNSYTFIVFFACIFIISRVIPNWNIRKSFLLVTSYGFYAAWNPPFVILLWISTSADWFLAKRIRVARKQTTRRFFLILSLGVNLGILGYFKYGMFIFDNFLLFIHSLGIDYSPARPSIVLPIGISFYTFRSISYTFDIFRRQEEPWHSFIDYALYVSFSPSCSQALFPGPRIFCRNVKRLKKGLFIRLGGG